MMGCKKCRTMCAVTLLVLGVLFLLADLNIWEFWNIQWWTALFILWGAGGLAQNSCPDCQAILENKGSAKKK